MRAVQRTRYVAENGLEMRIVKWTVEGAGERRIRLLSCDVDAYVSCKGYVCTHEGAGFI